MISSQRGNVDFSLRSGRIPIMERIDWVASYEDARQFPEREGYPIYQARTIQPEISPQDLLDLAIYLW